MITIAVLVVTFALGAMASAILLLRAGIASEEANNSLLRQPPTRAAAATRRILDFRTQIPQR